MTDQSKSISRRWLYIPFAIAAVIFVAYYFLWRSGAGAMEKAAEQWIDDQRAIGMVINHAGIGRDGFPFFLRVYVDAPVIGVPGQWRWRAEQLAIDVLPYDLSKVIFSPIGEQELYAADYGDWRAIAGDFKTSIARDKNRGWKFSATIGDATARHINAGAREGVTIDNLAFDLSPDMTTPTTLVLTLVADDVDVTAAGTVFHLADLKTILRLSETDQFIGPEATVQWRDAGGVLEITRLIAVIEETVLSASGRISLDAASYPVGRLDAEIANPAGMAHWLGAAGALSIEEAESTGAGLTLLAIAGGGKISAPIEFRDGGAQIAGVKLADLPPAH